MDELDVGNCIMNLYFNLMFTMMSNLTLMLCSGLNSRCGEDGTLAPEVGFLPHCISSTGASAQRRAAHASQEPEPACHGCPRISEVILE